MRIANLLVAGSLLLSLTMPALADNPKNPTDLKGHPRVNQVNQRIKNQHAQIKKGVKSGKLTGKQAAKLHAQRKAIKGQEHADRKADKGHLTKADQKQLNKEEKGREKEIKHDESKNAATTAPKP